ncbi:hypothetical protein QX201_005180 [Fusarium graminearum]|nr:hypothetical protein FGRA07_08997 [Fusarium graminearum]CAF3431899.1 unnamed protein product [Fusarium graminearum]
MSAEELEEWNSEECEFRWITTLVTRENHLVQRPYSREPDGAIPPLEVADADAHIREAPLGRPTDYKRCQASGL